jgi:hypothetical protein
MPAALPVYPSQLLGLSYNSRHSGHVRLRQRALTHPLETVEDRGQHLSGHLPFSNFLLISTATPFSPPTIEGRYPYTQNVPAGQYEMSDG